MTIIFLVAVFNLALGFSLAVFLKHGAMPAVKFSLPLRFKRAAAHGEAAHDQTTATSH